MAILGRLAALLIQPVLEFFWGKIEAYLAAKRLRDEARAKIKEDAQAVREKSEKADTKEERDDAAKSTIRNF
jgi:uncharacterized protein YdaU (DUF1376 family)